MNQQEHVQGLGGTETFQSFGNNFKANELCATHTFLGASLGTETQMGLEISRVPRVLDLHPLFVSAGQVGDLQQDGQH